MFSNQQKNDRISDYSQRFFMLLRLKILAVNLLQNFIKICTNPNFLKHITK